MNRNNFARLTGSKRNMLALLASSAIFTAGCANMATTAPDVNSLTTGGTLTGKVHGGNQPVSNSAVTLYYAGQGSVATAVAATTTSASDGTGSYSFIQDAPGESSPAAGHFSCPTSGDPLVYVVARGGNTINSTDNTVNNTAAVFLGIYTTCNELGSGFIDLNEVTTVASLAAVQQFFDPATEFIATGGSGAAKAAIVGTTATIANMISAAAGTANGPSIINPSGVNGSTGVTSVTVTATPENQKINLLANILAACVNNAAASAAPCVQLFANTTPPDSSTTSRPYHTVFAPATDVLQALYYILTNPTNGSTTNLQNIFNLAAVGGAPFQPSLATAPSDWTIGISYSSISGCGSNHDQFISSPSDINIDFFGNLWIANSQGGNLAEISSSGAPIACIFFGGSSNGGGVLDSVGNVWFASTSSSAIYRYSPFAYSVLIYNGLAAPPLGVTADGAGNVYFSTTAGSVYEIPGGATATTAITPTNPISTVVGPSPIRLMPDQSGAIWTSSGSNFVSRIAPSTSGTDPNISNGFTTTKFPTTAAPSYGIAVTRNNNVYVSSFSTTAPTNIVTYLVGSGTSYAEPSPWPISAGVGGLNNGTSLVIDAAQNVWIPNNAVNTTSGLYSVSEISAGGNPLSPNGTAAGGFQKAVTYLGPGRASVVDQAGNVWVASDGANFVTEFVGQGVPVYQPYAVGLSNGHFQSAP